MWHICLHVSSLSYSSKLKVAKFTHDQCLGQLLLCQEVTVLFKLNRSCTCMLKSLKLYYELMSKAWTFVNLKEPKEDTS